MKYNLIIFAFILPTILFSKEALLFYKDSKIVRTINFGELEKKIPSEEILFPNLKTKKIEKYKAFNLFRVLNLAFGPIQDIKETHFLFGTTDGYVPKIKGDMFYKKTPYLAYERIDNDKFVSSFGNDNEVPLGPYFLIWKNIVTAKSDIDEFILPYAISDIRIFTDAKSIEVSIFDKANIKKGYNLYQKKCIACHEIKGIGGKKGPNLFADNFISDKGNKWLAKYILYPKSINPNSKMPQMLENDPKKILSAFAIADYMKHISQRILKEKNKGKLPK